MKILTTKQQNEAIEHINRVENAILSGNAIMILDSIGDLAELTYIVGGLKELKRNSFTLDDLQAEELEY